MRASPPGRLIDLGGRRLHLFALGQGRPTVVFEAALGASSVSWTFVHPEVAGFARACVYDRAGFRWSDRGPLPRTAGRIADDLRRLLQRAGEPPPYVLVGHSYGGFVTRIFAARFRSETAALVLVDAPAPEAYLHPTPEEQARIDRGVRLCRQGAIAARLGIARLVSLLASVRATRPARAVANAASFGGLWDADSIIAPIWKLPEDVRRPLGRFWTQPKFFEALGSQIATVSTSAAEVLEAEPPSFGDLPLVTISCANPSEGRVREQQALAARSTRGRHVIASTSGHWVPLDEPQLIVEVVRTMTRSA